MTEICLIDTILAPYSLSFLFQPIVHATAAGYEVHGYEALARGPAGTNVHTADVLFEYVRRKQEEARVDRLCVAGALESAAVLDPTAFININVHASTLTRDAGFPDHVRLCAARAGIDLSRIILEIVEYAAGSSGPLFAAALGKLRQGGCAIALDDVGLSNHRMIVDSRPDYYKVDRFLVNGVASDSYRLAIIRSLVTLAHAVGATVVAEGVESEEDVDAVRSTGVSLFQGFFFSRPKPASELAAGKWMFDQNVPASRAAEEA